MYSCPERQLATLSWVAINSRLFSPSSLDSHVARHHTIYRQLYIPRSGVH